jgi:hypothetical protein
MPQTATDERFYTVKEAADLYFQGKVSAREVYFLFASGLVRGFRVGSGKGKILIYESSLEAYRRERENGGPPSAPSPPPTPAPAPGRGKKSEPTIRLSRLPEQTSP